MMKIENQGEVLVFIILTKETPLEPNVSLLKKVFSDPYFSIEIIGSDINLDEKVSPKSRISRKQKEINKNSQKQHITLKYIQNSSLYSISIFDNSVVNITPEGMKIRIQEVIAKSKTDICYLCSWNDLCNQYQNIDGLEYVAGGSSVLITKNSQGAQAVLYSPYSREIISGKIPMKDGTFFDNSVPFSQALNQAVQSGNLTASTFVPNIVDFDIEQATSDSDFGKLNKCQVNSSSNSIQSNSSFIWFIAIVIILIIVFCALIYLGGA